MTHLAPKQGLFAIVIFVSFCLHTLALTITATNKQNADNSEYAHAVAKQVAQELQLPLSMNDPVGVSVIASRYTNDALISYIGVYDNQNRLLAPIGSQDSEREPSIHDITAAGVKVGKLAIIPAKASSSKIMGDYIPFFALIFILHALVWFCYGYIARPNKDYYEQIYREARKKLIASGIPINDDHKDNKDSKNEKSEPVAQKPNSITPESLAATMAATAPPAPAAPIVNDNDKKLRFGSIFDKLKGKTDTAQTGDPNGAFGRGTSHPLPKGEFHYYSNEKMGDNLYVYISFLDPNNLLNFLEESPKQTYIALCNQLLQKSTNKVLARPILSGVRLEAVHEFSRQADGRWVACIQLSRHNNYARLALAGAMLAKLIPSVHQAVYNRHRELGQFALPMKAIACDDTRREASLILLQKRDEQSLLLLSHDDINSILVHFNVARHKEANALYEKECRIITTAQHEMLKQLTIIRDAVLLQD